MTVLCQENTSGKNWKQKDLAAVTGLAGFVKGDNGNAEFLGIWKQDWIVQEISEQINISMQLSERTEPGKNPCLRSAGLGTQDSAIGAHKLSLQMTPTPEFTSVSFQMM